jgi:O-succinylbenzoate synthase
MLERKRILKVKEQVRIEGKRIFIYEQPKTGDVFTIPDPELQLNQLEEVQRDVAQLLEHGLSGQAPSEATEPTTAVANGPAVAESAVS